MNRTKWDLAVLAAGLLWTGVSQAAVIIKSLNPSRQRFNRENQAASYWRSR